MDPAILVGVLSGLALAWVLLVLLLWVLRPRDARLRDLVRIVPDVLRLVRHLLADRAVPGRVRVALAVLLVWLVSPIDLIPEFIPVLGPLDDVVVAVYTTAFDWIAIRTSPLNYIATGAMGLGSSHALGLALGRPDKRVLVLDGSGTWVFGPNLALQAAAQSTGWLGSSDTTVILVVVCLVVALAVLLRRLS